MAKPCTLHPIPQAEQFFKIETANVGAILSRERMAPFVRTLRVRRE